MTQAVSKKTWCLDCFERREPWVIRWLVDHGVRFRHVVLEEGEACHSCRDALPLGTHVMSVRYPGASVAEEGSGGAGISAATPQTEYESSGGAWNQAE